MDTFIIALFVIICLLLIVVVLLQKGRGGGLGAAFGGLGSSAFGTRVGDVFTWVTIVLTALFLLLGIVASLHFRQEPGTVAVPIFQPGPDEALAAGTEQVSVAITCETDDAKIYYTLDGSEPVEGKPSIPYPDISIPISLTTEGQTLRARAFKRNWTPSPIAEGTYRLPTSAPASEEDTAEPTAPADEVHPAPADAPATAPAANR